MEELSYVLQEDSLWFIFTKFNSAPQIVTTKPHQEISKTLLKVHQLC